MRNRDDNRTMTDQQDRGADAANGAQGAEPDGNASPFGAMKINFGGASDAAPLGGGLNPFGGGIAMIADEPPRPPPQPGGPTGAGR